MRQLRFNREQLGFIVRMHAEYQAEIAAVAARRQEATGRLQQVGSPPLSMSLPPFLQRALCASSAVQALLQVVCRMCVGGGVWGGEGGGSL
jgi:hypothetical protein